MNFDQLKDKVYKYNMNIVTLATADERSTASANIRSMASSTEIKDMV